MWDTGADSRRVLTSSLVALAEDDAVAAVAACLDLVQELDGDTDNELAVIDAFNSTTKPVALLANLHSAINPEAAARLRAAGVPVLEGTRTGLLAMKHLLEWRQWQDRRETGTGATAMAPPRRLRPSRAGSTTSAGPTGSPGWRRDR